MNCVHLKTALIDQLDPAAQEKGSGLISAQGDSNTEKPLQYLDAIYGAHGLSLHTPGYSGPAGA